MDEKFQTRAELFSVQRMEELVLMYDSKSWIMKENDKSKLQGTEMRFLRRLKGCIRRDLI